MVIAVELLNTAPCILTMLRSYRYRYLPVYPEVVYRMLLTPTPDGHGGLKRNLAKHTLHAIEKPGIDQVRFNHHGGDARGRTRIVNDNNAYASAGSGRLSATSGLTAVTKQASPFTHPGDESGRGCGGARCRVVFVVTYLRKRRKPTLVIARR